ncbi:hypothetical protein Tco_1024559 [Tanacetum coccineum]
MVISSPCLTDIKNWLVQSKRLLGRIVGFQKFLQLSAATYTSYYCQFYLVLLVSLDLPYGYTLTGPPYLESYRAPRLFSQPRQMELEVDNRNHNEHRFHKTHKNTSHIGVVEVG